jgi:hypothetical protein
MEAGKHVLKHLDLSGVALFEKRTDDAHFEQMAVALPSLAPLEHRSCSPERTGPSNGCDRAS